MAVFTAIASAIVGAIGISTATIFGTLTWAGLATSVIAGGLAMGTAKVLGVFKPPNIASAKDPGVKVQVSPGTDNKVPVFYGSNLTGGIIVDAGISNGNDTMTYVIVLGEKTDTGTYTIGKQYRGDQQLNFGFGASTHVVTSVTDANATSTNKVNGKMRVRIYAGGTAASDQIFPASGNQVAATTLLSTITAATSYDDLVFAVFQIDYDVEEGLTGLGQYTTEITNSLNEPGAVLNDYLLNSRYGAGLRASDIDATSIAALTSYCTEQVDYTTSVGAADTHDRWAINGMMGTYSDVFTNIDLICQACSTFFTYNPKEGKFEVVPNREATTAEKSAAYVFDDDNLLGAIDVSSTELYSQYNSLEAEFPDGAERDQTSTVLVTTPSGELNPNEPENKLTTRYPIVNDAPRATNLAQIDLRQSRKDLVVQLKADYAAIQTDVGDIVKLTNATYGFTEKLFRVMRVTETEAEDGMLSVSLVLLEYDDGVYTHIVVQDSGALDLTGIPGWYTGIWGNVDYSNIANIISGNIIIVDDPLANIANVIPNPGTGVPSGPPIPIGNVDIGIGGEGIGSGGGYIPSINFPITIPNIPDISQIIANLNTTGSSVGSNVANTIPPTIVPIMPPGNNTTFVPGEVINVTLPQPVLPPQDQQFSVGPLLPDILANIDLSMINYMGQSTALATAPNITLSPKGTIDRATLGSVQAGLQYEEDEANFAIANSAAVNAEIGTPASIISPIDIVDLGGIDYGEFSSMNDLVVYGGVDTTAGQQIAFQPAREISYKEFDIDAVTGKYTPNANSNVIDYVYGSGIQSTGITNLPTFSDGLKYTVSESRGGLIAQNQATPRPPASATKAYVPDFMQVINYANSDLAAGFILNAQTVPFAVGSLYKIASVGTTDFTAIGASSNTVGVEFTATGAGTGSGTANINIARGFDVTNADKRISKSDAYLDIGGFF
jgi:hypothetical protein